MRKVSHALLALLASVILAVAAPAQVTLYVDALNGNNGNAGTALLPKKTIAGAVSAGFGSNHGDRLFLSGTFRENIKLDAKNNLFIGQWAGKPQAVLRGDTVVAAGSWTSEGGDIYRVDLSAGSALNQVDNFKEAVASVVVDWDKNIDTLGRHFGHLRRAQSAADCTASENTWWYDYNGSQGWGTARRLKIHLAAGDVLANLTVAWCRANVNGIEIGTPTYTTYPTWGAYAGTNVNGLVIDGLHTYLWCDSGYRQNKPPSSGVGDDGSAYGAGNPVGTVSIGYSIRGADCVDSEFRNIVSIDSGYHGPSYVGDACRFNVLRDIQIWGGAPNTNAGNSSTVFYSGPGLGTSNIIGCRGYRVRAFKYTFLGRDGKPVPFPFVGTDVGTAGTYYSNCDGLISHTNAIASTNEVQDVEWQDCEVIESGDLSDNSRCVGNGLQGGGSSSTPTNALDWRTYPVRFVRCKITNGSRNLHAANHSVAFYQCRFEMARMGPNISASGAQSLGFASGSGSGTVNYTACEFVLNMHNAGGSAVYAWNSGGAVGGTFKHIFINSAVYGTSPSTSANDKALFFTNQALGKEYQYARGSIFGYQWCNATTATGSGTKWLVANATASTGATEINFRDCFYFNISVSRYIGFSGGSNYGGESAYRTSIDPTGVFPGSDFATVLAQDPTAATIAQGQTIRNAFADWDGRTLRLSPHALGVTKTLGVRTDVGFNGRVYSGHYGPWQYGGTVNYASPPSP